MLVNLFYLSAIWLVLALILAIRFGTRIHRGNFFLSLAYLAVVIAIGDAVALAIGNPLWEIFVGSMIVFWLGIPAILLLRHWNAPGQTLFLFGLIATVIYLFYAFAVTAFAPLSPVAFLFSFLLFVLETAALILSLLLFLHLLG